MEHDWEDRPLAETKKSNFEFDSPSGHVQVHLDLHFIVEESIKSIRVCRICGLESVNGEEKSDCATMIVTKIMES